MKQVVSVVMPVFNSARFVREALDSVMAQTYEPLEVVVVDGPSTDATAEIVRSFAGVRYLRQTGSGMWNASNEGVRAARGDLLAFLSDDDLWQRDKILRQVELLEQRPELGFVGGRVKFVPIPGEEIPSSFRPELFEGDHEGYMPEVILVRRAVFEALGGFAETYRIAGDIEWLVQAIDRKIPRAAVADVVLHKRIHADNLSSRPSSGALIHREILDVVRQKLKRGQRRDG